MQKYWGEMKALGACGNIGRVGLFKTYNDVAKHMKYRCGSEDENPYLDNGKEGELIEELDMGMVYRKWTCTCPNGK